MSHSNVVLCKRSIGVYQAWTYVRMNWDRYIQRVVASYKAIFIIKTGWGLWLTNWWCKNNHCKAGESDKDLHVNLKNKTNTLPLNFTPKLRMWISVMELTYKPIIKDTQCVQWFLYYFCDCNWLINSKCV